MRDRILNTEQAAEAFCVPTATIQTWHFRGMPHAGAPGFYKESEVADFELRTRRRARLVRCLELAVRSPL